jgi:hypothetical protein
MKVGNSGILLDRNSVELLKDLQECDTNSPLEGAERGLCSTCTKLTGILWPKFYRIRYQNVPIPFS